MVTPAFLAYLPGHWTSGALRVRVQDPGGSVVTGASILVSSESTNLRRTAVTGCTGEVLLNWLPVGFCEVQMEAEGFLAGQRSGLSMTVNQTCIAGIAGTTRGQREGIAASVQQLFAGQGR